MNHEQKKSLKNRFLLSFRKNIGDKVFLKRLAKIGLPIYFASILGLIVNFVDSVMVAPLGSDKIAAVNASAEILFFSVAVIIGVSLIGFIYYSQYHGKDKTSNETKEVLTTTLYWMLSITFILIIFIQFFGKDFVSLFLKSDETRNISSDFLSLVSFSLIPLAISRIIISALIRSGKAGASLFVSITSLVVNVVLNYMFINGIGVPELGLKGVALSTLIARIVELGVAISIILILRVPEFKGFGNPKLIKSWVTKKMATKGLVLGNEILWSLSLIVQFGIITTTGDDATAVIGSAHVVSQVLFAAHGAFGGIINYFIGRRLGKNHLEKAKELAKQISKAIFLFSTIYSVLFFIISFGIVQAYAAPTSDTISAAEFEKYLLYAIWVLALAYSCYTMQFVFVNLLWAGGKVGQAFIGDVLTNWLGNGFLILFATFSDATFFELFCFVLLGDTIKVLTLYYFYRRFDWVINLTLKENRHPIIQKITRFFKNKGEKNEER